MTMGTEALITLRAVDRASKNLREFGGNIDKVGKAQAKQKKAQDLANKSAKTAADANDKLKNTMRSLASSIAVIDGPLGGVASRFNAFGTTIGRVDKRLIGLAATLIGISAIARGGLKAFGEVEKLTFRLGAALENTGRQGQVSIEELSEAAAKLGRDTLTSREAALEAITTLASFEDIPSSKLVDIANLAQDLSVVLGGDLKQNAILLGRSFNDLESASEFLRRKGLKLNQQQRDHITTLIEQGKQLEAITFFQQQLSNIQGLGAKEAQGLTGVFDTLGEQLRDTTRAFVANTGIAHATIGILKGLTVTLKALESASHALGEVIAGLKDTFILWGGVISIIALRRLPALLSAMNAIATSALIKLLPSTIIPMFVRFNLAAGASVSALTLLNAAILTSVARFKTMVQAFGLLNAVMISTPVGLLLVGLAGLSLLILKLTGKIDSFGEAWTALRAAGLGAVFALGEAARFLEKAYIRAFANIEIRFERLKNRLAGRDSEFGLLKLEIEAIQKIGEVSAESALAAKKLQEDLEKLGGFSVEDKSGNDPRVKGAQELSKEQEKILDQLEKQRDNLKEQVLANNILLTGAAKTLEIATIMAKMKKKENQFSQAQKVLQEQLRLTQELEKQEKLLENISEVTNIAKDGFVELAKGAADLNDILASVADKLATIALEAAFDPVGDLLKAGAGTFFSSLLPFAKGAVIHSGDVQKFARGTVLNSPTAFPLNNGTGIAGEAGPEGILPLARTSGGDLGVKAIMPSGGGSGNLTISLPIKVDVTVEGGSGDQSLTNPEDSRQLGRLIAESVQTQVLKVIDKETRPGGRLSPNTRKGALV